MLEFSQDCTVYIACGGTDLRKSFHSLAAIIKLKCNLDPYSRCMFAFCNRNRSLLKILRWDGSGFWLLMKRIDKGNFRWPDTPDQMKQDHQEKEERIQKKDEMVKDLRQKSAARNYVDPLLAKIPGLEQESMKWMRNIIDSKWVI